MRRKLGIVAHAAPDGEVVHILQVVLQVAHHREKVAVAGNQNCRVKAAHFGDHIHRDANINPLFARLRPLIVDVAVVVVFQPVGAEGLHHILPHILEFQKVGVLLDFLKDGFAELVKAAEFVFVPLLGLLQHQFGGQFRHPPGVVVHDALRPPQVGRPGGNVLRIVPVHPHQLMLPAGHIVKLGQGILEKLLPAEVLLVQTILRVAGVRRVGAEMKVAQVVPEVLPVNKDNGFQSHFATPCPVGTL